MIKLLNLDISGKNKPTDSALRKGNEYDIYFRITDSGYDIDYEEMSNFRLTVRVNKTTITDVINITKDNVIDYNGTKYLEWKVPSVYLKDEALLINSVTVNYKGSNKKTQDFNLQVYEKPSPEINGILNAIDKYNTAMGLYIDSIKRTEIGSPNGVVPLDNNSVINESYFNPTLSDHIPTRLIDTLDKVENIHGLKLNKDNNHFEYYDDDDLEYYVVNQIHGGQLGFKNKSSEYNIFGGTLEVYSGFIDSATFNTELEDVVNGGNLADDTSDTIDGGSFLTNDTEDDKFLNRIHGGFL